MAPIGEYVVALMRGIRGDGVPTVLDYVCGLGKIVRMGNVASGEAHRVNLSYEGGSYRELTAPISSNSRKAQFLLPRQNST